VSLEAVAKRTQDSAADPDLEVSPHRRCLEAAARWLCFPCLWRT
jgi:hypothetical protein